MAKSKLTKIAEIAGIIGTLIALFVYFGIYYPSGNSEPSSFHVIQEYFFEEAKGTLNERKVKKYLKFPFWNDGGIQTKPNEYLATTEGMEEYLKEISDESGYEAGKIFLEKRYSFYDYPARLSVKEFEDLISENGGGIENVEVIEITFNPKKGRNKYNMLFVFVDKIENKIIGIDD